jgi:hypothetical protein
LGFATLYYGRVKKNGLLLSDDIVEHWKVCGDFVD